MAEKDGEITIRYVSRMAEKTPPKTREQLAAIYGAGVRDSRYQAWLDNELRRPARAAMGPFIAGLAEWRLFPTFTYDMRRFDVKAHSAQGTGRTKFRRKVGDFEYRRSAEAVQRDLRRFVRALEKRFQRPVQAVFALERHKSGHFHVHGLIGFLPGQGFMTGMLSEVIDSTQLWYRQHGYAKVRRIETEKDMIAIAEYCSKYMTKDEGDLVFCGGLEKGRRDAKSNQNFGGIEVNNSGEVGGVPA